MGRTERRARRGEAINPATLRQARLDAGLTLAQVAGSEMTRQAVYRFEMGLARPTRAKLEIIAERLGVSVKTLRADARDPREQQMADLEEQRRFDALEQLAQRVLRDRNARRRTRAVAYFFAGRAAVDRAPREALAYLRKSRQALARLAEPWLAAEVLDWEAVALYHLHDMTALDVGRRALREYRELVDASPRVVARMLEHLGSYLLMSGDNAGAISSYREALEAAGSLLDLTRLGKVYHGLAEGHRRSGETRQAIECMERAIGFYRTEWDVRGGSSRSLARLENDYGLLLVTLGRWDRAEEMIRAALSHFTDDAPERPHVLLSMAELLQGKGNLDEAMEWTAQAMELAERMKASLALGKSYEQQGELYAWLGDHERFEASFARALEIFDAAGLRERRIEAVARYHRLGAAAGASAKA